MLPPALPFTAADAERWIRAGLPRWVTSVALPALWALAVVVAVANDTARCTPQDPSVCGPDSAFALWFAVCLATPVLLWWMPVLGCLAGVAFALADLRSDDSTGAHWAFGLHGLLCALVAVRLVRGAAEQRRIATTASGGRHAAHHLAALPGGSGAFGLGRLAVAGVLVLAGIGLFAWYELDVSGEREHLSRAVQVPGQVVGIQPDESVTVKVRTPTAGTRDHRIGVVYYTDSYPLHSSTPVLVDPQDPDWIRLVAEPQDSTGWQSAGAGCLLLALLWLLHSWRWKRDLAAVRSGEQAMLRVRIRPDAKGRALILPAPDGPGRGAERPIGRLAVFEAPTPEAFDGNPPPDDEADAWDEEVWDHQTQAEFGRAWRDEDPAGQERFTPRRIEDAVLIGDVRDGGVAMLVTADAVLLPDRRLRGGQVRASHVPEHQRHQPVEAPDGNPEQRRALWWRLSHPRTAAKEELFPGLAIDPASLRQPLQLPITARPSTRSRAGGLLAVLAGFVGFLVTVYLVRPGLVGLAYTAWIGSIPVGAGVAHLFGYLRLDHHRFEVAGLWRTHLVPWDRLHGVRKRGQAVVIAWEPDLVIQVGPFDDPAGELRPQDWTEQLGAMMLLQRQRALLGGQPGRRIGSRPSMAVAVRAAYAVLVVVTAVVR